MLELKNVSAGYNGLDVIHNLSFKVARGENLCILGPNGCGKTTLLKAIAGLVSFKGDIEIDGISTKKMKRQGIAKNIAILSQISNIYFAYSVFETVLLGRYLYMKNSLFKEASEKDIEETEKSLEAVGLLHLRDRQIDSLSGGQLQRVFLARALAQDPQIILLDEPTNHLDLRYQKELIDYLKAWSEEKGKTVIGVFHDINLAMSLADNILVMEKGHIAGIGEPRTILRDDLFNKVYEMDIVGYMVDTLKHWEEFYTSPTIRNIG